MEETFAGSGVDNKILERIPVELTHNFSVMAGLVPAIHVFLCDSRFKAWMPGTRPGMTERMVQLDRKML